jgi:hypothetical protein
MKNSNVAVRRLATKDINRVTAYLYEEIETLKKRTTLIEDEDLDKLIRDICTEEFDKLGEGLLIEKLEETLDLSELADAVAGKVLEKLGRD